MLFQRISLDYKNLPMDNAILFNFPVKETFYIAQISIEVRKMKMKVLRVLGKPSQKLCGQSWDIVATGGRGS